MGWLQPSPKVLASKALREPFGFAFISGYDTHRMEWHTSCAHLGECALTYMPDPAIYICIKVWKTVPLAPMPCPPSWSSFILLIILTYCRMISLVWCLRELQRPIGNTLHHTHTHGCPFHLDSWPFWMELRELLYDCYPTHPELRCPVLSSENEEVEKGLISLNYQQDSSFLS